VNCPAFSRNGGCIYSVGLPGRLSFHFSPRRNAIALFQILLDSPSPPLISRKGGVHAHFPSRKEIFLQGLNLILTLHLPESLPSQVGHFDVEFWTLLVLQILNTQVYHPLFLQPRGCTFSPFPSNPLDSHKCSPPNPPPPPPNHTYPPILETPEFEPQRVELFFGPFCIVLPKLGKLLFFHPCFRIKNLSFPSYPAGC